MKNIAEAFSQMEVQSIWADLDKNRGGVYYADDVKRLIYAILAEEPPVDLTPEWLFSKGFEIITDAERSNNGEKVYHKDDINIEMDFDGWYLCAKDEAFDLDVDRYYLGTKPHWTWQVELLYKATTGNDL